MNNISIYQIILSIISLTFIVSQLNKFLKGKNGQTFFKLVSTETVWLSILAITFFPELSHYISMKLGFGENLNTLIFIGFVIIFVVIFKLLNIIERIERNLSELIRKEALEKIKGDINDK